MSRGQACLDNAIASTISISESKTKLAWIMPNGEKVWKK